MYTQNFFKTMCKIDIGWELKGKEKNTCEKKTLIISNVYFISY